jgi:hypothetical protein
VPKKTKSFTVDEDIAEQLENHPEINASAVVNDYLGTYLKATNKTQEEVVLEQLNERIENKRDEIESKEDELQDLIDRRDAVRERMNGQDEQAKNEAIEAVSSIPADPTHPLMEKEAEEVSMTATELAKAAAEEYNKEFDPYDNA